MITNLFLLFVFIVMLIPFFFIGFVVETMQAKKLSKLRDEIARQARQQTIQNQQR